MDVHRPFIRRSVAVHLARLVSWRLIIPDLALFPTGSQRRIPSPKLAPSDKVGSVDRHRRSYLVRTSRIATSLLLAGVLLAAAACSSSKKTTSSPTSAAASADHRAPRPHLRLRPPRRRLERPGCGRQRAGMCHRHAERTRLHVPGEHGNPVEQGLRHQVLRREDQLPGHRFGRWHHGDRQRNG